MDRLADELLKDILSPQMLVPDEVFANQDSTSPFAKVTRSASDVLLVCKRWMRVATPPLYATVVIRTKAQAFALNMALSRNPQFGQSIKRLRLEGAFGEFLTPKIIKLMPGVAHLCFTLGVYSDDKIGGLQAAFTTLQPQEVTLTLCQPRRVSNKVHARLVDSLCDAIPKWSSLVGVGYQASSL
jgi:hypothetical protein